MIMETSLRLPGNRRAAKPFVRGRIARSRGDTAKLVRSRSVPKKRVPPIPFIGSISRWIRAELISDYETLSDTSWSTGNFYETVASGGATSGRQISCIYKVVTVPNQNVDEVTGLMDPLRFRVFEPATADSPAYFDGWDIWPGNGVSQYEDSRAALRKEATFTLDTLLPVSGDSHISDGQPSLLSTAPNHLCCAQHIAYLNCGYNPLLLLNTIYPYNSEFVPRYCRVYLNGVDQFGLIDMDDWLAFFRAARAASSGQPDRLFGGSFSTVNLWMQNYYLATGTGGFVGTYQGLHSGVAINDQLDFTAGDEIYVDVWY